MRQKSWLRWAVLAVAILGGVLLVGRPSEDGPPLDPGSSGPLGTRGLVLLLEELGADVEVTSDLPGPNDDAALVLADNLDDPARASLRRWVGDGGTLVVTDPSSPIHPFVPASVVAAEGSVAGTCPLAALAGVERLDPAGGVVYTVLPGATGCFLAGDGAFVAVVDEGEGTIVAVGGAGALVNATLGHDDNAVLAGALLAPEEGTRVVFLQPPVAGAGQRSLTDLIGDNVWTALWQLAIAFVLFALWRARRLGHPVPETQPVELPASELVTAMGHLLQQAGRRDQAGALLASDLRRRLAETLGLGADASAQEVAAVASVRTGIPEERLHAVLSPVPLRRDDDLVALAASAETTRQELTHV